MLTAIDEAILETPSGPENANVLQQCLARIDGGGF